MTAYSLGHSSTEQERLQVQARYMRSITEAIWRAAGIGPGMRVIDVGCGVGDTTFLAAELVGPTGSVVGMDRSAEALSTARERAAATSLQNVQFVEGNIHSPAREFQGAFNAVVGRLILVHQPDVPLALRNLRRFIRTDGLLAFHEGEFQMGFSGDPKPTSAAVENTINWLKEACRLAGIQPNAVSQMPRYYYEAGLGWPQTSVHTLVSSGANSFGPGYLTRTLRTLLPVLERGGIASAGEVDLETLEARLTESCANGAVSCALTTGGSWVRVGA